MNGEMWFKKLNSKEYEDMTKKIIGLYSEIENLKVKFKIIETNMDNLRGNFNRKLNKARKEDLEIEGETTQDLNKSVLLPDNGHPFGRS